MIRDFMMQAPMLKLVCMLIDFKVGPTEAVSSTDELMDTGVKFYNAKNYENALPYFENVAKQDSKNANGHLFLGLCKQRLGCFHRLISIRN